MPTPASSFTDIVQARHSVRSFLPDPLSASDIRGVLEDAQAAPSNCNTQPWTVHIVSGAARDALSKEILRADEEGRFSPDFTFDYADFGDGAYLDRAHHHAATITQAQGLKREDREARKTVARKGREFFGAPHAAFLFMPTFGDGVRAAGQQYGIPLAFGSAEELVRRDEVDLVVVTVKVPTTAGSSRRRCTRARTSCASGPWPTASQKRRSWRDSPPVRAPAASWASRPAPTLPCGIRATWSPRATSARCCPPA